MTARIQREHIYQAALKKWVTAYVVEPKVFLAFDRAKPPGRSKGARIAAMERQKARGIETGTPDTVLLVPGFPAIWWECKAPLKGPTEEQDRIGKKLMECGNWWSWASSVSLYAEWIAAIGVPLQDGWKAASQRADLSVAAMTERAEMRAGKLPKRFRARDEKPTTARIRKIERLRSRIAF